MIDLKSLTSGVWLMQPDRLLAMFKRAWSLPLPTPQQLAEHQKAAAAAMRQVKGKIAVLPIEGVIERRWSLFGMLFGGFSTEEGHQALDQLAAAKDVEAVVLDVDSPGGDTHGVEEFAQHVKDFRATKPIYAMANGMMCSAAYWIGSQATQVVAAPSSEVGSIGVYAVHMDHSAMLAEDGVKPTIVKSGKFKAEFNPFEPLSKEGKDYLQEQVDASHTKFVKAVAAGRGIAVSDVREKYGQGRAMNADQALGIGMVDKVLSFSALMARLGGGAGGGDMGRRATAEVLRCRHDLRVRRQEENHESTKG